MFYIHAAKLLVLHDVLSAVTTAYHRLKFFHSSVLRLSVMSGIEIAGLALTVLPILMSAVQQYNNCLGPFNRYKRFAKEARGYYKELDVQRIIFRNQCRHLLEEIVDHEAASRMLNSLTQKAWTNKKLDEKLALQLGESLEACIAIIELIEQRIEDISGESEGLKSIVEQEKKVSP